MENSNLHLTILDFEISLNLDIFEVGIVNLIITIILVAVFFQINLVDGLDQRQDIIIKKIEDAEIKLKEARQRLNASRKQFSQIVIISNYIKSESINRKKKLLNSDLIEAERDLALQFERAYNAYFSKERIVFLEIKKDVILRVLNKLIESQEKIFSNGSSLSESYIASIISFLELKGEWI